MSIELKIKAKHLAAESKIIKFEEAKVLKAARKEKAEIVVAENVSAQKLSDKSYKEYRNLNIHRKCVVREEARATHLARAFINGVPYRVLERTIREPFIKNHILDKIMHMANKYGREWDTETRSWSVIYTREDIRAWTKVE